MTAVKKVTDTALERWKVAEISQQRHKGTSLVVRSLGPHAPSARGPAPISAQGTRPHLLQLRVCMLQLKIPHALSKDQRFRVLQRRPCTAK